MPKKKNEKKIGPEETPDTQQDVVVSDLAGDLDNEAEAKPKAKGKHGTRTSRKGSTSFYLSQEILDKLKYRADGWADNRSKNGRLEADLLTLWAALDLGLAYAAQKITRNEAKSILDVMNGTWWDASNLGLMIGGGLTINIEDGISLEQLDKKWEFNGPDLVKKLGKLDRLEMLGLLDWARIFWAHDEELDIEEYVARFQPDPE